MARTTTKITIPEFKTRKASGQRVTMITIYDYPMARLVDQSPAEMILVGDPLGMVIQGLEHTNPVTLDEIIYHARAVRRGAPSTLIVGDMPFMSYQVGPEQAVASAGRIVKESGADCIKMEGGESVASSLKRIVLAGIPVVGHIGLTPQFVQQYKRLAPEIVDGFGAFTRDVRSGSYPTPEQTFTGGEAITGLYPTD